MIIGICNRKRPSDKKIQFSKAILQRASRYTKNIPFWYLVKMKTNSIKTSVFSILRKNLTCFNLPVSEEKVYLQD